MKLIQEQLNQFNQSEGNCIDIEKRFGKNINQKSKNQSKKIIQYTTEGEFVREFNSIAEANRYFNLSDKYISKHIRGRTKTCVGFVFKLKE